MGEVDELQDAVDHGVAERDQGVDGAQREAVDEVLEEVAHHGRQERSSPRTWLAVLATLQDDGGLHRVAVGVDGDGARHALEVLGGGDGVADGRTARGPARASSASMATLAAS